MVSIIADPDVNARRVLRALLIEVGYQVVLEAKGPREVIRLLRQRGAHVRLVVSSWAPGVGIAEIQALSEELRGERLGGEWLAWVPWLVLPPRSGLVPEGARPENARIDCLLPKPFGRRALRLALRRANASRVQTRNQVLVWLRSEIPNELAVTAKAEGLELREVKSVLGLKAEIARAGTHLRSIWIDPFVLDSFEKGSFSEWLARFKKNALGMQTPVVCLSQNALLADPLRLHGDVFVEIVETEDSTPTGKRDFPRFSSKTWFRQTWSRSFWRGSFRKGLFRKSSAVPLTLTWSGLLELLSARMSFFWEIQFLLAQSRQFLRAGDIGRADRLVCRALHLDSLRAETHELAGDVKRALGRKRDAAWHYAQAIATHPCSPHSYIGLQDISESAQAKRNVLESAKAYCPRHPEILRRLDLLSKI